MGLCIMGTPDQIEVLFKKLDTLVASQNATNIAIENLRGVMSLISERLSQKASKSDIAKHALQCSNNNKSGFWSGMTAAQKTTVITATLTAIGTTVAMIFNNIA